MCAIDVGVARNRTPTGSATILRSLSPAAWPRVSLTFVAQIEEGVNQSFPPCVARLTPVRAARSRRVRLDRPGDSIDADVGERLERCWSVIVPMRRHCSTVGHGLTVMARQRPSPSRRTDGRGVVAARSMPRTMSSADISTSGRWPSHARAPRLQQAQVVGYGSTCAG